MTLSKPLPGCLTCGRSSIKTTITITPTEQAKSFYAKEIIPGVWGPHSTQISTPNVSGAAKVLPMWQPATVHPKHYVTTALNCVGNYC